MATVYNNPNQDDDQNQQNQSGQSQNNAPPSSGGAPAGPIMGGGGQTPQPASSKGTSSGRFTNINKYIQANQGNDYASKVGNTIDTEASKVKEGIQGANQQAQQQFNPEQQRLQGAGQTIQQALADPTAFAQNDQNVNAFNQIRQGQYGQVAGQQDLASKVQGAQDLAGLAGNESGRYELLRRTFGQQAPAYTQGQQRLDQLLLQGQGGQLAQLGQKANATSQDLGQQLSGYQQSVAGMNDQLKQLGTAAQQQAQQQLGQTVTSEQQRLQDQASQLQQQRQDQFNALQQGLQSGQITEDQAKMIGLDPSKGDIRLWNTNANSLLNKDALGQVGVGNVATDTDRARLAALTKLGADQSLSQFAAPAGQLQDVGKTFNTDVFNQQRAGNEAEGLGTLGYEGRNVEGLMQAAPQVAGYKQHAQQAADALDAASRNPTPENIQAYQQIAAQVKEESSHGGPTSTIGLSDPSALFFQNPQGQYTGQYSQGFYGNNMQGYNKLRDLWGAESDQMQGGLQDLQNRTGYNNMLKILKNQPQQGA